MRTLLLAIVASSAVALGAADSGCIVEDNSTNPCYPAYSAAAGIAVAGTAVAAPAAAVDMRSLSQAVSNAVLLDTSAPGMVILLF